MASDDRNETFENLTAADSFTDPSGTTHTGGLIGGVNVENTDGTTLLTTDTLQAGGNLQFSDDGDGTATLGTTASLSATSLGLSGGDLTVSDGHARVTGGSGTEDGGDAVFEVQPGGDNLQAHVRYINPDGTNAFSWLYEYGTNGGYLRLYNYATGQDFIDTFNEITRFPDVKFSAGQGGRFEPQSSAPSSPQNGDVQYADGTNWDPGSGAGFYGYEEGSWVKL